MALRLDGNMAGIFGTQLRRGAHRLATMTAAASMILAATALIGTNVAGGAWAGPAIKTAKPAKPNAGKTPVAVVVPLPVRKPDAGYAHPGVRGPRPARIEALLPPVRFKIHRHGGKLMRREIGRRPPAELIAAAKARLAKSVQTEAKPAPASKEK